MRDGPRAASQLRAAYEYFEKLLNSEKSKREHSGKLTDRVDAHKDRDSGRGMCAGDRKMLEVDRMLHALKINYSRDQLMFFDNMKESVMPAVYKHEWEDNAARVMEMLNIERVGRFLAINTPRRWGKTTSVAAFVVSLLIGSPGIEICVFSTGGRASGSLMETAKRMMSVMPSLQRRVCKEDHENLYVCEAPLPLNCGPKSEAAHRARSLHSTSRLHSFPDSVEGQFGAFLVSKASRSALARKCSRWSFDRTDWSVCCSSSKSSCTRRRGKVFKCVVCI